jgi:organic hydroperoxide reductase OsmC/OhrA
VTDIFLSHLEWTGHTQHPVASASFSRDLAVAIDGITLPVSSAPGSGGDPSRVNPEQLFVAALSACQALTCLEPTVAFAFEPLAGTGHTSSTSQSGLP